MGEYAREPGKGPDPASASHAAYLAESVLELAKEAFASGDYHLALAHTKDAIRLASSAVLIRDGYITDDFDKTVVYLSKRYGPAFPIRGWEKVEMTYLGGGGLYNAILRAMGKPVRSDRELVGEAIAVAETFITTARMEVEM